MIVRPARVGDSAAIAAIQHSAPEASSWDPSGYDVLVAELDGDVIGFIVTRRVAFDEVEILNLAVAPQHRRRRVATNLLSMLTKTSKGVIFLEVRESNAAARKLYQLFGFKEVSHRTGYYDNPPEAAIVMNFHSC